MYYSIINPEAGQGTGSRWRHAIEEFMRASGQKSEIIMPSSAEEAKEAAERIALHAGNGAAPEVGLLQNVGDAPLGVPGIPISHGTPRAASPTKGVLQQPPKGLIIVGGDGTLQAVVSGLLANGKECELPISIIPCGSGNDFVRSLDRNRDGGTKDSDILARILAAKPRKVDAMRVNGHICLNIANTGLDAMIVKKAQRLKPVFRGGAYYAAAFLSIISHRNRGLKITARQHGGTVTREGDFTLAAMCNGQYYGGGMRIAPAAAIDDGQITLCMAGKLSRLQVLRFLPLVLLEKHTRLKQVEYLNCTACRIELPEPATLCMDGNLSEGVRVIDCEVLPGAVRVRG